MGWRSEYITMFLRRVTTCNNPNLQPWRSQTACWGVSGSPGRIDAIQRRWTVWITAQTERVSYPAATMTALCCMTCRRGSKSAPPPPPHHDFHQKVLLLMSDACPLHADPAEPCSARSMEWTSSATPMETPTRWCTPPTSWTVRPSPSAVFRKTDKHIKLTYPPSFRHHPIPVPHWQQVHPIFPGSQCAVSAVPGCERCQNHAEVGFLFTASHWRGH